MLNRLLAHATDRESVLVIMTALYRQKLVFHFPSLTIVCSFVNPQIVDLSLKKMVSALKFHDNHSQMALPKSMATLPFQKYFPLIATT